MRPRMSPLEIQKREFSRKWKGLDPVEVQPFLDRRRRGHGSPRPRKRGPRRPDALARAGERGAPRARADPEADAPLGAAGLRGHPQRRAQGSRARRARGARLGREADPQRPPALRRDRESDPRAQAAAGQLPPAAAEDDRALPAGPRVRPRRERQGAAAVLPHAQGEGRDARG